MNKPKIYFIFTLVSMVFFWTTVWIRSFDIFSWISSRIQFYIYGYSIVGSIPKLLYAYVVLFGLPIFLFFIVLALGWGLWLLFWNKIRDRLVIIGVILSLLTLIISSTFVYQRLNSPKCNPATGENCIITNPL